MHNNHKIIVSPAGEALIETGFHIENDTFKTSASEYSRHYRDLNINLKTNVAQRQQSIIISLRWIWSIGIQQPLKKGRDTPHWVDAVDDVDEFMSRSLWAKCNWTRLLRNYEIFMNELADKEIQKETRRVGMKKELH